LSLLEKDKQSRNAHVLGCLRLNGEGLPVAGQRLAFDPAAGRDALSQFLAADPLIAPFLNIPSKENGLDIEGIAARAERVLVGLRGPWRAPVTSTAGATPSAPRNQGAARGSQWKSQSHCCGSAMAAPADRGRAATSRKAWRSRARGARAFEPGWMGLWCRIDCRSGAGPRWAPRP
jgi:hypothetical protein